MIIEIIQVGHKETIHRLIIRQPTPIITEVSIIIITIIIRGIITKITSTTIIIKIIPITEDIIKTVVITTGPTTNITITTTLGRIKHTGDGSITSAPKIEMMEDGITEDRGAEAQKNIEEAVSG